MNSASIALVAVSGAASMRQKRAIAGRARGKLSKASSIPCSFGQRAAKRSRLHRATWRSPVRESDAQRRDTDRRNYIVIVDEDGKTYLLKKSVWSHFKIDEDLANARGSIEALADYGAYLAFVPDVGVGYGTACTVVNLRQILRNNPPSSGG